MPKAELRKICERLGVESSAAVDLLSGHESIERRLDGLEKEVRQLLVKAIVDSGGCLPVDPQKANDQALSRACEAAEEQLLGEGHEFAPRSYLRRERSHWLIIYPEVIRTYLLQCPVCATGCKTQAAPFDVDDLMQALVGAKRGPIHQSLTTHLRQQ